MERDEDTDEAAAPVIPEELVITLPKPLKVSANDEVETVTLREPTAGEMKRCDKFSGYEWMIELVAEVSGLPAKVVEKMRVSDLNQASAYLTRFIEAGRLTRPAS